MLKRKNVKLLFSLSLFLIILTSCTKKETVDSNLQDYYEPDEVNVSVNIYIDDSKIEKFSHDYEVPYGFRLMELMKEHYRLVEEEGQMKCIEGNPEDRNNNLYWIYTVNKKPSKVNANKYELQEGDTIDWKLTVIE